MPGGTNLASKYLKAVDERFFKESQSMLAFNNKYDFTGGKNVNIYSISVAPLNDYSRSGTSRYGTPDDLARNVQTMTVSRDRGFTYIIDKGDLIQSEMVMAQGESLAREIREVIIPEFDQYVFRKLASVAKDAGNYATTTVTTSNAYAEFLAGMEFLGNHNVPEPGRVCFCSYAFAHDLMQDPAFIKNSDLSQDMLNRGVVGECDGCMIVKVSSRLLPANTAFILAHKDAATAPKQLEEYREHIDPPGVSGVLIEGRMLYDCFVLDEKVDAIYFHTGIAGLKELNILITPGGTGKINVIVNGLPDTDGNTWAIKTAATKAALPAVTEGTAINLTSSTDPWYGATVMTGNSILMTLTTGHKFLRIVEIDSGNMPVATVTKKIPV